MSAREIYLDFAAATPLDERVFDVMVPYLREKFYNPSASYMAGRTIREDFEDARHRLAMAIGAKQHEVIMTAGATESINLAIHGVIAHYGGRIATSSVEHAAVLASARCHDVDMVNADNRGWIDPEVLARSITPNTTLVSIGYVNNELGTVQSLRDIASVIEQERMKRLEMGNTHPIFFHTDASQATGLLDISVSRLGVDMMTLNSSKCYGPKQVGLLWVRAGVIVEPIITGGGQENGVRSGTENVAGTIGFAAAVEYANHMRKEESYRLAGLRDRFEKILCERVPDVMINGHIKRRAPHISHVSVSGLDGERAVYALDQRGVLVATGSACAANKGTRSHVLTAVGMDEAAADGSLRMSFGRTTTEQDVDDAAQIIAEVIAVERLR